MTWKPISEAELRIQIQSALGPMSKPDRQKFDSIRTPLRRIPCRRSAQAGSEEVFVLAHVGSRVLLFDDVEDEFGVGNVVGSSALERWELLGDLSNALRKF